MVQVEESPGQGKETLPQEILAPVKTQVKEGVLVLGMRCLAYKLYVEEKEIR